MIPGSEIHVLDKNAEFLGVPPEKLMENAGKHVADFIISKYKGKKMLILCGTGNNGGDGFVAARYISPHQPVTVFLVGTEQRIRTNLSKKNFVKLKNCKIKLLDINHAKQIPTLFEDADVIIDAMLGIGLSGTLKEPYHSIVDLLNKQKEKRIVSVDVPTGLGTNLSVHPQQCITFHEMKDGMNKKTCGDIIVVDIGIPTDASVYIGPGDLSVYYPEHKKTAHKGDNGRVLVVGGGPYYGAPVLSALGSLRTGADLVHIATPLNAAKLISGFSPNFIVHPFLDQDIITKDDILDIVRHAEKADAVVLGPGLGDAYETMDAVPGVVKKILKMGKPLIIDADGLKALGKKHDILKHSQTVITPHAGEFKIFTGESLPEDIEKRKKLVFSWAKKLDITIFLKGPIDIISDGKITKLNRIHNEAMTVGGTGDVLAGIIGSLLSKKVSPINAARIAAFLNGEAGNYAFSKKSYGLLATDVIEEIPTVLKEYL